MVDESWKQWVPWRDGTKLLLKQYQNLRYKNIQPEERIMNLVADTATFTSIWGHGKSLGSVYKSAMKSLKKQMGN